MINITLEANVKGLGEVYKVENAPFDEALKALGDKEIITARDLAYARIKEGKDSSLSQNGSYIREGVVYVLNSQNKIILIRNSLILKSPKKAVQAHRKGEEYLISKKLANNVSKYADDAITLSNVTSIPTNRFGEDQTTAWLFNDMAKEYGLFLKDECDINEMLLSFDSNEYINKQKSPYANQLWLHWLDNWSGLDGYGRFLYNGDRAHGVRLEHETQKISESSLDSKVQAALNSGLAFEHKGKIYAPINTKNLSLNK